MPVTYLEDAEVRIVAAIAGFPAETRFALLRVLMALRTDEPQRLASYTRRRMAAPRRNCWALLTVTYRSKCACPCGQYPMTSTE
jgi:hypothetical protein